MYWTAVVELSYYQYWSDQAESAETKYTARYDSFGPVCTWYHPLWALYLDIWLFYFGEAYRCFVCACQLFAGYTICLCRPRNLDLSLSEGNLCLSLSLSLWVYRYFVDCGDRNGSGTLCRLSSVVSHAICTSARSFLFNTRLASVVDLFASVKQITQIL